MSLLSKVTTGVVKKPHLITVFGPEGAGKTTFAAKAPKPIFACIEDGANRVDVARLPKIENYAMMMAAIEELTLTSHDYQTFVIDSLDHFEPILWRHVCEKKEWSSIEEPGFGKGYVEATQTWIQFFEAIKKLREKMNVILICHSHVKSFNDPSLPAPYDRYEIKLHKGATALLKENVEAILFATYETVVSVDKMTKKAKGFGGDNRVLYTEYRAHHDGKNRYGLPYQIDLSWDAFIKAVESSEPNNIEALQSTIVGLISKLSDAELKQKANSSLEAAFQKKDVEKLIAIKNRVLKAVQEQE